MPSSPEGEGGSKPKGGYLCDKSFIWFFSHPSLNPSLEICFVIPKEGIVTRRVAELLVPGCKDPSVMRCGDLQLRTT